MTRLPVAIVSLLLASCAVGISVRPARAQALSKNVLSLKPGAAEPVSSYEGTAGVRVQAWTKALATDGRLPNHERMLVVSSAGEVLSVVDGDRNRVILPAPLAEMLARMPLDATLVHNHPDSVSLSGADLFQLAKVGVSRVVALGHDGSVYEASAAARFGEGASIESRYDAVLQCVLDRVIRESQFSGADLVGLYPHIPHVVALIFERAGVIHYSVRPSVDTWVTLERYRSVIQRVVDLEAPRLRSDLAARASALN